MRSTLRSSDAGTSLASVTVVGKSVVRVRMAVAAGRDDKSADKSAGDENWFADACTSLYGPVDERGRRNKAGTALWAYTGADERSCQRYASGEVKTPGNFVRALLRGDDGWTWLSAIMDDASPPWWAELQRAKRYADALREVDRAE